MTPNSVSSSGYDNSGTVTVADVLKAVEAYKQATTIRAEHLALYEARWVNAYVRYCGRCGESLRIDRYAKKDAGKWQHAHNGGVWCKNDKQHGPKTRYAFPLPSLLVIEEMEL